MIPVEVAEPLPAWLNYLPWVAYPLAALGILFLHRYMLRRRRSKMVKPVPPTRGK
jgi:hypothetical protein